MNNTAAALMRLRATPAWWCAGYAAGTALQLQQSVLWVGLAYPVLVVAALLLMLCTGSGLGAARRLAITALLTAIVLGFGMAGWRATHFAASALNPALEGKDVQVTGMVLAMPQRSDDAVRFRLAVESAELAGQRVQVPEQVLLGWYSGFGNGFGSRRTLPADTALDADEEALALQRQPQNLRAGERWQMTVRLKAPHGNSNPFGFDYELWLWEQGIQATGYVRAGAHDAPPARLSSSWQHPVEQARQSVREAIYQRVADRQLAGVLAALVVGDQGAIERADWDVFRTTGVAHLMSISGLHITMFGWLASGVVGALWRRSTRLSPRLCMAVPASTAGSVGGLLLAGLYALFSGWGVPAQRTIWMLAAVVVLRLSGRRWPATATWLLAMAVVVACDPWALVQAGFWLSFVAVGVLFATDSGATQAAKPATRSTFDAKTSDNTGFDVSGKPAPWPARIKRLLTPVGTRLAANMREQWVVTLALTPLSLLLFNQVSLVGLLANAVAIPWVTLVLTPLAMLGMLWPPSWDAAALATHVLTAALQWLSTWPLAAISVPSAPLWAGAVGVLGGLLLALHVPWRLRLLGVPLLLPVLLWQPERMPLGQFEVLAADIGQGNAVLVRTARHSLLYDAGPRYSNDSDAGQRVLVPLLRALGERLDMVMLSHRDSDHIGGAPAVLAMQPQAAFYSSVEDAHPLQAQRTATRCVAGQRWVWDGVEFEVLHPDANDYGVGGVAPKSNAMSCVLRVSNGAQTALLVGDIEAAQEARLVAQPGAQLKADVLLVPHHGSKTSSTGPFLDAVAPRAALAQAGYRNRFNHPVPAVAARYEARGIALVRSDVCGAATWRSTFPENMTCQRKNGLRYWHHVVVVSN